MSVKANGSGQASSYTSLVGILGLTLPTCLQQSVLSLRREFRRCTRKNAAHEAMPYRYNLLDLIACMSSGKQLFETRFQQRAATL